MRRILTATVALLSVAALAAPATAVPGGSAGMSPAAYCRSVYQDWLNPVIGETYPQYVIPVEFNFGGEAVVEPFGLATFQACLSTVAFGMNDDGVVPADQISKPAYIAQCDLLERYEVISYPYMFYRAYEARHRAGCARILQGVHTGRLALPELPPVG